MIAISKRLGVTVRDDWKTVYVEDLWGNITIDRNVTINLFSVYLAVYLSVADYSSFLNRCASVVSTNPKQITCIIGDFNLGEFCELVRGTNVPLNYSCQRSEVRYNLFRTISLFQLNHITNQNNRLLDMLITNGPDAFSLGRAVPITVLTHTTLPLRWTTILMGPCYVQTIFMINQKCTVERSEY